MRVLISAGEASGENYGALLIPELRKILGGHTKFFGVGGERMRAAGCEIVVDSKTVAVLGITEVIKHIPRIYREFFRMVSAARRQRPDVAVLIDFPDFNLRLAERLHRMGVPVVYFVSPQLWAWKKRRIRRVQRYVDRMLVIFPLRRATTVSAASKQSTSDIHCLICHCHKSLAKNFRADSGLISASTGLRCCREAVGKKFC